MSAPSGGLTGSVGCRSRTIRRRPRRPQVDFFARLDSLRERWNVLEHPFYQRWSDGAARARGARVLRGRVPPRRDRAGRGGRRRRARVRARGARAARRARGGRGRARGAVGRVRERAGRRRRPRAARRDAGLPRVVDGRAGRAREPRGGVHDRVRPARDRAHQARRPGGPVRLRGGPGHGVLLAARRARPRARGAVARADRGAARRTPTSTGCSRWPRASCAGTGSCSTAATAPHRGSSTGGRSPPPQLFGVAGVPFGLCWPTRASWSEGFDPHVPRF